MKRADPAVETFALFLHQRAIGDLLKFSSQAQVPARRGHGSDMAARFQGWECSPLNIVGEWLSCL